MSFRFVDYESSLTLCYPKVLFQLFIGNAYAPLKHALPLSLADKTFNGNAGVERSDTAVTAPESHEMTETTAGTRKNEEYEGLTDRQREGNRAARMKSEEEYGFAHPAASRPQRIVWFPRDRLGLAEEEERGCREAGVDCSVKDAELNDKGKVDISGAPPDLVLVDE